MDTEGEWRKKLNECETSLRRLCGQARAEGSSEKHWDVGAKAGRRTLRPLRGVLGLVEGCLRDAGGFFQWAAAGLRVRLGRPIGELLC